MAVYIQAILNMKIKIKLKLNLMKEAQIFKPIKIL